MFHLLKSGAVTARRSACLSLPRGTVSAQPSLLHQPQRFFTPPPPPPADDGAERNDYESKGFQPYNYNHHGEKWDAQRWPLVKDGREQSPINLYRTQPDFDIDGRIEQVQFDDRTYKHRYRINYEQTEKNRDQLWTGTSYQVGLDYKKDFMTTQMINLFNEKESDRHSGPKTSRDFVNEFTTRGVQYHFHNPAEHTIDGRKYDMEMHIVHKLMYVQKNQEHLFDKWRYAVTAIMFEVPKYKKHMLTRNQVAFMGHFENFMHKIIEEQEFNEDEYHVDHDMADQGLDLQKLLSFVDFSKRWIYRGSFTSPPCLEGVLWQVVDDVQVMNERTLQLFKNSKFNHFRSDHRCDFCAGNNRLIMPYNGRTVYYVTQKEGGNAEKERCEMQSS